MTHPEEPLICLAIDGTEVEVGPEDTWLFTFYGELSMYDHVYLVLPPESIDVLSERLSPSDDDSAESRTQLTTYIFRGDPRFAEMASFMIEHRYPQTLYVREVDENDKNAYFEQQMRTLDRNPGPENS